MKHLKPFNTNTESVVGIVTAILLVGLLITVFSIVQTVYVPEWMKEIERDHMDVISSQFAELKHTLDIQVYTSSPVDIPISTPITLGSTKIPYFLSERSSGSLHIKDDIYSMNITGDTSVSYSLGTITYASQNSYYLDQNFVYENGAVILNQDQGSLLVSNPFIAITQTSDSIYLNITCINITHINGKNELYGSSTCSILTSYTSSENQTISNCNELIIDSSYLDIWENYIDLVFSSSSLVKNTDYTITQNDEHCVINFDGSAKNVIITLDITHIAAQLSPGWIN